MPSPTKAGAISTFSRIVPISWPSAWATRPRDCSRGNSTSISCGRQASVQTSGLAKTSFLRTRPSIGLRVQSGAACASTPRTGMFPPLHPRRFRPQ
ncbi:hypothetical protein ACFPRL_08515 [Pseudoclavibacter helvolus]